MFRKGWGVGRGERGKVFRREGKGGSATGVKSHAGEEWVEKDRVSWRRVSANNDKDERGATSSRFAKMKTETGLGERTELKRRTALYFEMNAKRMALERFENFPDSSILKRYPSIHRENPDPRKYREGVQKTWK